MTGEEFDAASWRNGATCIYHDKRRTIVSVDFEEQLIGLKNGSNEDMIDYVRCESVSDVTFPKETVND